VWVNQTRNDAKPITKSVAAVWNHGGEGGPLFQMKNRTNEAQGKRQEKNSVSENL